MNQFFLVKLENGSSLEVRAAAEMELKVGDLCVFKREFCTDSGMVVRPEKTPESESAANELPAVLRRLSNEDRISLNENILKAKNAMNVTQTNVDRLKLDMKLLNAHYSLDGKMLLIQFCADGRVDFRELVKELSRALSTRIELRQIGVRDETSVYGGIGVCGQQLCCSRFLKEFNSINVKMAKDQDLSLTPSTISGVCGRLKCCLKFEHEGYVELEKHMPRKGEFCECPQGRGRICDRNLLTQKVSVHLESGNVTVFPVAEITVLKNTNQEKNNKPCNKK